MLLRRHRDAFFAIPERLSQDDELDDGRLLRLREMNKDICSGLAFEPIVKAAHELEREQSNDTRAPANVTLPAGWGELVYNYFMAVSYTRTIRGILLRAQLFGLADPRNASSSSDAIEKRVHDPRLTALAA
jgi:hypothetical protein